MDSQLEILRFHFIDRKLYAVLAFELVLDPLQAMNIMAYWLCLERLGFRNTVSKILSLPNPLISELALEAIVCLNHLTAKPFRSSTSVTIPLTERLVGEGLCIPFLEGKRSDVFKHLKDVIEQVCHVALMDLMQDAQERNKAMLKAERDLRSLSLPGQDFLSGGDELRCPSLPPPVVHPDDRTLFITFSRGYPVAEEEIRDFFTVCYGNCIESLHMQEPKPREQSLYARMVFYSPATIDNILSRSEDGEKVKFTINGKHAWTRKFVPKNRRGRTGGQGLLPSPNGSPT